MAVIYLNYNQFANWKSYAFQSSGISSADYELFIKIKIEADPTRDIKVAENTIGRLGFHYKMKNSNLWSIYYVDSDTKQTFYDWFKQQNYGKNQLDLTKEQLANMFTGFNSKVADKQYQKMVYNEWKILKSIVQQQAQDDVATIALIQEVCIAWTDKMGNMQYNYFEDPEFKRYIKENYFNKPVVEERKDEEKMDIMKKFDFGTCEGDNVRFSPYGMAVKNQEGTWVAYNKSSNEIIDVDIFNFEGGKYFLKMPVAISQVAVGDVIIHQRKPMIVVAIPNDKEKGLYAVDPVAGERKNIMLTKSVFGFDFITKVVSLLDFTNNATEDAPFGNMFPFFLLQDGEFDPTMLLLMNNNTEFAKNPLMLYALMGKGKSNDMLPLLLMANNGNFKF